MEREEKITKEDIIDFFDKWAPGWDAGMKKNDEIIGKILDNAGVSEGTSVLDVACGTGVLFPYYLDRNVQSVVAIDISPEMAKIAQKKETQGKIQVICDDVEEHEFKQKFDSVVVYNAFPHFPDSQRLIGILAGLTKTGGRMTIAHGMSRAAIERHHSGVASKVSVGLMHEEELKKLFEPFFEVDTVISTDAMYQVAGIRK